MSLLLARGNSLWSKKLKFTAYYQIPGRSFPRIRNFPGKKVEEKKKKKKRKENARFLFHHPVRADRGDWRRGRVSEEGEHCFSRWRRGQRIGAHPRRLSQPQGLREEEEFLFRFDSRDRFRKFFRFHF